MKISLLSPYLSSNGLSRAFALAKVLERHYEVEIVGPVSEEGLWKPLSQEDFDYRAVTVRPGLRSIGVIRSLLAQTTGDVVYASKALLPSFGVGLLRKLTRGTSLVLDMDDWEFGAYLNLSVVQRLKLGLRLNAKRLDVYYPFIWLMHKFIRYADARTAASRFLKDKYDAVLVPHGRDTSFFDPARFDAKDLKRQYGSDSKLVMFLGTPRPHKGLEDLIEAVRLLERTDVLLMIVGVRWSTAYAKELMRHQSRNMKLFGMQPFSVVPRFLAMADVVVVPQRLSELSKAQVPAKIFEAMAMAKPVVATAVSDIPDILRGGCGLVVEPENPKQLAEGIAWLLENGKEAEEIGRRAREVCVEKYSWDAMEKILVRVFAQFE